LASILAQPIKIMQIKIIKLRDERLKRSFILFPCIIHNRR
jgi:hypothetical protein